MSTIEQVKPTSVRTADRVTEGAKGWWDNSRGFLTEVRSEMRRVTWPTWNQVRGTTGVVIAAVFAFALYFFVVDFLVGRTVTKLFDSLTR